jgi:hypothetical protein
MLSNNSGRSRRNPTTDSLTGSSDSGEFVQARPKPNQASLLELNQVEQKYWPTEREKKESIEVIDPEMRSLMLSRQNGRKPDDGSGDTYY